MDYFAAFTVFLRLLVLIIIIVVIIVIIVVVCTTIVTSYVIIVVVTTTTTTITTTTTTLADLRPLILRYIAYSCHPTKWIFWIRYYYYYHHYHHQWRIYNDPHPTTTTKWIFWIRYYYHHHYHHQWRIYTVTHTPPPPLNGFSGSATDYYYFCYCYFCCFSNGCLVIYLHRRNIEQIIFCLYHRLYRGSET